MFQMLSDEYLTRFRRAMENGELPPTRRNPQGAFDIKLRPGDFAHDADLTEERRTRIKEAFDALHRYGQEMLPSGELGQFEQLMNSLLESCGAFEGAEDDEHKPLKSFLKSKLKGDDFAEAAKLIGARDRKGAKDEPPPFRGQPMSMDARMREVREREALWSGRVRPPARSSAQAKSFSERYPDVARIKVL